MSIWYSISTHFTLRPDADRQALADAVDAYRTIVPSMIVELGNTVWIEAEGDMSRHTADLLYAELVQLIRCFGTGEAVRVYTRTSDDDDELHVYYVGRKAAVLAALGDDLARRIEALRAGYACQVNSLADKADDAFVETVVETEGW